MYKPLAAGLNGIPTMLHQQVHPLHLYTAGAAAANLAAAAATNSGGGQAISGSVAQDRGQAHYHAYALGQPDQVAMVAMAAGQAAQAMVNQAAQAQAAQCALPVS